MRQPEKRKRGRPATGRAMTWGIKIDLAVYRAMQDFARLNRRSVKAQIELAAIEQMRAAGYDTNGLS